MHAHHAILRQLLNKIWSTSLPHVSSALQQRLLDAFYLMMVFLCLSKYVQFVFPHVVTVAANLDNLTRNQCQNIITSAGFIKANVSLWATCYQLLIMEVKPKEEIKVLPPFSFPFFLRRTLPCTCTSSSVHLAYIYWVHKCNNNPPYSPCGHWAGKQMLDFTSKIEPTRGNLNKNSLLAHITLDEKRNNGTHKEHTCGCCELTIVCN